MSRLGFCDESVGFFLYLITKMVLTPVIIRLARLEIKMLLFFAK